MRRQHGEMHSEWDDGRKFFCSQAKLFNARHIAFSKLSPGHRRQHMKAVSFGVLYGRSAQFFFDESHRIVESPHGQ